MARRRLSILLPLLLGVSVSFLAGCGGDRDTVQVLPVAESGPIHVHGLGLDERTETLYIATHTGLWQLPAGASQAARVTDRRQDTMGFTVVEPGRFLGSGHPDQREADPDVPPLLGLIESADGGRAWERVSLHGEADFHVLRAAGARVYGFDSTSGVLRRSRDGGRSWTSAEVPEPLLDLVVDPADPAHLVASGEAALYESTDGGGEWRVLSATPGYLGWPRAGRLYLFGVRGDVGVSSGPGRPFRPVGSLGSMPHAVLVTRTEMYAALDAGEIRRSTDGGVSWKVRSAP